MAGSDSKPITPDEILALAGRLDEITTGREYWDDMTQSATLLRRLAAIAERCKAPEPHSLHLYGAAEAINDERKAIAALIAGVQP